MILMNDAFEQETFMKMTKTKLNETKGVEL